MAVAVVVCLFVCLFVCFLSFFCLFACFCPHEFRYRLINFLEHGFVSSVKSCTSSKGNLDFIY